MAKWKKHKKDKQRHPEPFVSISKKGTIIFNVSASEMYLEGFDSVLLFKDEESDMAVGIKPCSIDEPDSYKICGTSSGKTKVVYAYGFFKDNDLLPDYKTIHTTADWDDEEEMIVIFMGLFATDEE